MKTKLVLSGLCVVVVILSGCAILQAANQDTNSNRIKDGLSKTLASLGGSLPDGVEDLGDDVYVDMSNSIIYLAEDDQVVYASIYAFAVSPSGKMTDFDSGRTVRNSSGRYTTQYDEMDEAEWVLEVYWDFLKKENFLLVSGDGSPGTIYQKGSIYAGIYTLPQRDDGLIPLRMMLCRDLDLLRDFVNE